MGDILRARLFLALALIGDALYLLGGNSLQTLVMAATFFVLSRIEYYALHEDSQRRLNRGRP